MFSKACEYGIRSAIYIAGQSAEGKRANLQDIACAIDSPVAFTAKILQILARNRIICAAKGPTGGYTMDAQQISEANLARIVAAIDGKNIYLDCGLGLKECDKDRPCPIHHKFERIREGLREMLETTSLPELAEKLETGAYLKR